MVDLPGQRRIFPRTMLTAVLGGDHSLKGLISENLNSFLIRMGNEIRALCQKLRLVAVAVSFLRQKK